MKYRAEVLTPTLVGDGSRLSPIDYMVWRDQVNVLNQARIFRLLAKGQRLETYLAQLRKATKLDFESWGGFAQNYAGRRIPFEDSTCTPHWNKAPVESLSIPAFTAGDAGPYLNGSALKGALRTAYVFANTRPGAVRELANRLPAERAPRNPGDTFEHQSVGTGGSDRMRAVAISDSAHIARDNFRVYLLRVSTLIPKGTGQFSLGWKPSPTFAEMAAPGTLFEGSWRENDFLNSEEVRRSLRWNESLTHARLFKAANQYAGKQLELHAQYAKWTGLETLTAAVASLQEKLEATSRNGGCLISIGWGAGFLSKSAAIGADDNDHRKVLATLPFYNRAIQSGLPFPKTRRIVFLKDQPATLPGWVELTVV